MHGDPPRRQQTGDQIMRFSSVLAVVFVALLASALPAAAATPKNALGAIAVSPDGQTVAAAGDNHVLYLIDPGSLEVRHRVHLGANPQELYYSADGKTLAVFTIDDELRFYDTATWKETALAESVASVALAAAADRLAALGKPTRGQDGSYTTPLTLRALADGKPALEVVLKGDVVAVAVRPDAGGFVLLTKQAKDESETKDKVPQDLQGIDKEVFEQQHDAYSAEIIVLDAAGLETSRVKTWYSQSGAMTGVYDGDFAYFLNYGNENLKVTAGGQLVAMFDGAVSYNYGIGVNPEQTKVATGSLREGAVTTLASGAEATYELEQIRGWPEYFKGFAFAPDGSVFGGTTSFRLIHVDPDGRLIGMAPIF